MDPTAIPAFDLPLKLDELASCVGGGMYGRTVGVEDAEMIALLAIVLAPVDEVAATNRGVSVASNVPVSHSNPSAGRRPWLPAAQANMAA